jgi:hypothetical protein
MLFFLINQLEKEIEKKYLSINYLKANFIQIIKYPSRKDSIILSGYLVYKSPSELTFNINETKSKIILKDTFMITIQNHDTSIQVVPKNYMFNPYYFLTEGIKAYKSEFKKFNDKVEINLLSDTLFYKDIKLTLSSKDYSILSVKAIDIYGVIYELKLKDIEQK